MAILVDDPRWPAHGRMWAHLISDSNLDELLLETERENLHRRKIVGDHSDVSLEAYLPSEGLGQLYLRLLTGNFEEATRARKEGRPALFTDDR